MNIIHKQKKTKNKKKKFEEEEKASKNGTKQTESELVLERNGFPHLGFRVLVFLLINACSESESTSASAQG